MAAVTVSKADKTFLFLGGGLKMEVVHIENPNDGDTYVSKLSNPQFAELSPAGDAGGTFDGSASVSGRTITIHDPASSLNHILKVYGDAAT